MPRLRVLLADDHNIVRAGLRALIEAQDDMTVIAEAADGETAWRLAVELGPDVAVMDVSMPGLGGAEATDRIRQGRPEVRVLALTLHENRGYLHQMIRAGALGYLLKRSAADDLIRAIHTVAGGGIYLDPNLAARVVDGLMGRSVLPGSPPGESLSDREEEVLRLIARGFTNKEVAARLDLSVKTAETYKARGMEKLGVNSRAGLVGHAIRLGWLVET
jgi:DNA-binding NarL/FixJ family response regulator